MMERRQKLGDEVGEVVRMLIGFVRSPVGMVGVFLSQINACAGHAPILQAGDPIFLVDLPVAILAGIAPLSAPHLQAAAVVASDDGDIRSRDEVREIGGGRLGWPYLGGRDQVAAGESAGWADGVTGGDAPTAS